MVLGAIVGLVVTLAAPTAQASWAATPRATWVPTSGATFATASTDDRVYVGGSFSHVRNPATGQVVSRSRIFAIDRTTGALVAGFSPAVDGTVRTIAVSADGATVYIGGDFTSVDGFTRTRLAALTLTGQVVASWSPAASRTVFEILTVGNFLYLAGKFPRIDGVARGGLARVFASSGELDRSWHAPTKGGRPRSLVIADGALLVGGSFTAVKGQPREFLASVSLDTGDPTAWRPVPACDTCTVMDLAVSDNSVYGAVAGPGGRVVRWSLGTGRIDWAVRGDGNVQAVEVADGVVYAGGHFGPSFGGAVRHQLAAVDQTTGALLDWAPDLGSRDFPGVWVIHADSDFLRIGGGFRSFEGTPAGRFAELARIAA
jgi:hypothetical protein